jgi:hypothetical protein
MLTRRTHHAHHSDLMPLPAGEAMGVAAAEGDGAGAARGPAAPDAAVAGAAMSAGGDQADEWEEVATTHRSKKQAMSSGACEQCQAFRVTHIPFFLSLLSLLPSEATANDTRMCCRPFTAV